MTAEKITLETAKEQVEQIVRTSGPNTELRRRLNEAGFDGDNAVIYRPDGRYVQLMVHHPALVDGIVIM